MNINGRLNNLCRTYGLTLIAAALITSVGCTAIPRTRVLPGHIQSVCVRMAHNKSYEPDLEEDLTRHLTTSILEDGRLAIERENRAEIVIEPTITDYEVFVDDHEDDDFPWRSEIVITASLTAWDPYDYDRRHPLGTWEQIEISHYFRSDPRRTQRFIDIDHRQQAIQKLATRITAALLYEQPTDLAELEEKYARDRESLQARERQIRFRSAYE